MYIILLCNTLKFRFILFVVFATISRKIMAEYTALFADIHAALLVMKGDKCKRTNRSSIRLVLAILCLRSPIICLLRQMLFLLLMLSG